DRRDRGVSRPPGADGPVGAGPAQAGGVAGREVTVPPGKHPTRQIRTPHPTGPLDTLTMIIEKSDSGGGGDPAIVFRLEPSSGVPTYRQLVQQVEQALRLGHLQPGDQLPRVRDVVGALAINPNTVLKAYRELEHRGLIAGRPGQGTFVQATLGGVPAHE